MKYLPLLLLTLVASFNSLSAATVVNFGGNYVSATVSSQRSTTSNLTTYTGGTGRSEVMAYSESLAMNPASVDYSGPTFYGGWYRSGDNATATNGSTLRRVANSGSADYINSTFAYYVASNATATEGAYVNMFLKADFTTYSSTPNLTFDLSNPLTMTLAAQTAKVDVRWMVKDGSNYYVSNIFYTAVGAVSLSSISSTTWALFNPNTSLDFDVGSATFTSQTFTDVQGVGFYAQSNNPTVDGIASVINVSAFSANLSPVPEPSTYALLGLGALVLGLAAKRRRTAA